MTSIKGFRFGFRFLLQCSLFVSIASVVSCTTPREYVYLNDIESLSDTILGPVKPFKETIIQPDDQLSITVTAYNPEDVQMFNALFQGTGAQAATGANAGPPNSMSGYIVDKSGMITLPYVGEFLAAGLTLREMEIFLGKQLERFVKQPVVKVRFLNHYVNVVIDNTASTQVMMNIEQMTLFDILARSGGLPVTAIRNNILVVREENGYRKTGRINVLSKSVFDNPYFQLQHRDMVYVEPVQASYINRSERFTKVMGPFTSIIGIFTLVLSLIQFTR